jgi:hypothetical protein
MISLSRISKCSAAFMLLMAMVIAGSQAARAQTLTAIYGLSGVIFTADSVNGNPPLFLTTNVMSGTFVWNYTAGDFQNGSGRFIDLVIPWTWHSFTSMTLTIDSSSLTGTLPGNFHCDGVDFGITLSPGLSSPTQGTSIATSSSTFDIWDSLCNEYVGHVTAGNVLPLPPPPGYLTPNIIGTTVSLIFPTVSNSLYDVQSTTNLVTGPWNTIATNLAGTGGVVTNIHVGGASVPQRFYRVWVHF